MHGGGRRCRVEARDVHGAAFGVRYRGTRVACPSVGTRARRVPGTWGFVVDVACAGATRQQVRRRGLRTKAEAIEALVAVVNAANTSGFVRPSLQTLEGYLIDDWLPSVKRALEPSTWASYNRYIRLHVVPTLGSTSLQALDAVDLNKLYAQLRSSGARKDGKPGGLSARTVRYIHTILGKALRDAVAWGRVTRNPADAARPPGASDARPPEMRVWSADQLAAFLRQVESNRYYPGWYFLATTGCRRGEALGLRWADIDLDAPRASIRQTITAVEHEIRIAPRTKTGRGRAIYLDSGTVTVLKAHRLRQAEEMLGLGLPPQSDTLVFCHPDGRPYHPERFSREFDRASRPRGSLAAHHSARAPAHVGDPRSSVGSADEDCLRTTRPQFDDHHRQRVLARHSHHAGRSR